MHTNGRRNFTSEMQLKWHRISCRFSASDKRGGAGSGTGRMQDADAQPPPPVAAANAAAVQHTANITTRTTFMAELGTRELSD